MQMSAPRIDALVNRYPAVPYVAPFILFILLTLPQGWFENGVVWVYPLKVALVTGVLLSLRGHLPDLRPAGTVLALLVGVVVFVVWIVPEGWYPLLGESSEFDPFANIGGPWVYAWIAVRLLGAAVLVAIVEELFWRGFLLRWIIKGDFRSVPLGAFTWTSFLVTSALFAVEHNRWLVGLLAGIAYNLLIYRTKSLGACILAHGVTNFLLGVYVLGTGKWGFW